MTELDMLDAVWQHATQEGLVDTFINVGMVRHPTVALKPSYGDQDRAGIDRMRRWARSIGATHVRDQHGQLHAEGALNNGTPVSVKLSIQQQQSEPTVFSLDELGQVAT